MQFSVLWNGAKMNILTLNGEWKMRESGTQTEYPVTVPGSVLSALTQSQAIPDPYYRDNEYEIRELFWKDYEFERTFEISKEQLSEQYLELVCFGLDTLAAIYLNEKEVAKTTNMHRTYRFSVKEYLTEGTNTIRIVFASTLRYMQDYQPQPGKEIHIIPCGCMEGNQYLRKAHSMFGWDWGAQLPDAGIWRDIQLECYSDARIGDVRIHQEHRDGRVTVRVDTALCHTAGKMYKVSLTLTPSWFNGQKLPSVEVQAKTAIVMAGQDHITMEIPVEKPKLWWPNGIGDQNLYDLTVSLKPAGTLAGGAAAAQITKIRPIDSRVYPIGLRTLTVSQEKDEWGNEFCFMVNGIKIFSKGANYIPEDCIYARITPERIKYLIVSAARANYNTMRVWGGGYYPSDAFYDFCDRYGLIVWQDLMYACNVYDLTDAFAENILAETKDNVRRLRHHASLGLWCGNNEIETAWHHWGNFQNETPYLRADYIKQFEYLLPKAVREEDDATFYWHSSPSSGGCLDEPDAEGRGDTHYWEVWHGQLPFSDYQNHFFRFCSEFGFQSFPSVKTVESYTAPEDRNIFSRVMESHQKNDAANGKMLYYVSENFRYPKNFESLLYVTQILQAAAIKSGVEHWRRNRGRCMGTLYWQINDNWPVASWASIDYFGRWKPLHYMAKNFYAPTAGSIVRVPDAEGYFTGIAAHYQNETGEPVSVKLTLSLKNMRLDSIRSVVTQAEVKPFSAACLIEENYADLLAQELGTSRKPEDKLEPMGRYPRDEVFVEAVYEVTDVHGKTNTQYESEVLLPYKYMKLQKPTISVRVQEQEKQFAISLQSDLYAPFAELDFADADVIFSDNCIHLTDRRQRVIYVEKKDILNGSFENAADFEKRLRVRSLYDTYE